MEDIKYYVYKITNLITNKIYIGCHQTKNLDDGYMGSGKALKKAFVKYGKENFVKEILSFHETSNEMFEAESKIVTREFIKEDNYNMAPGGRGGFIFHTKDGVENIKKARKNKIIAKDKEGNILEVSDNDPRWISDELVGVTKNKSLVKDKEGNVFMVDSNDPRIISGELVGITKGYALVKDKEGNRFLIHKDDPRLKSGELVGNTKGYTQSKESNEKRRNTLKGRKKPKRPLATCIHCKKTVDVANLKRWHSKCVN